MLKACRTPTIQTVTENRTASTDQQCEYLNGYVTVQHRSFGKPSFLDPRSSIIETEDSILTSQDAILASRNSKHSSFKTRGSSLEFRASSVNLLFSGTVNSREVVMSPSVHTIATSEVVVIFTSCLKRGNYGTFSIPNDFNSHFDNSLCLKWCLQS